MTTQAHIKQINHKGNEHEKGLLVMAYGTPYTEADIEPYYTHIRHGRKPSEEALQDLKDRYKAIEVYLRLPERQSVRQKH